MAQKVFQFKRARGAKSRLGRPQMNTTDINEQENYKTIQGKPVDSKEEVWVAQALDFLGFEFDYQYPILGGTSVRGGQVIDFLVHTKPYYTVLEVYGSYWHRKEITFADAYQQEMIKKHFGGHLEYLVLWDIELQSKEMAFITVRRELTGLWVS